MFVPTPWLDLALKQWWSRWVLRGRKPRAEFANGEAGWVLRYTARYRFTAVLLFLVFTGMYVFAILGGTTFKTDTLRGWVLIVGSVLIWLLFTSIFVTAYLERVVVTPGLLIRRSWRGRQEIPWSAVTLVRVNHSDADVRIGKEGGPVIEVSLYLDGLSAIAEALQQHLHRTPDLSGAQV